MPDDNYATTAPLCARADFNAAHGSRSWLGWVADRLPPWESGARILDAGCGPGWFWDAVTRRDRPSFDLTLLDRSEAMVAAAERRLARLRPRGVVADLADPAANGIAGPFDRIVCMNVLYHLDDPGAALDGLAARLAPGGAMAVTTITQDDLPEVNALTRDAYGHDPVAPLHDRFGAAVAERLLRARFASVERHDSRDRYDITDAALLTSHILSIPPGPALSDADRAAVGRSVAERIAAAGGTLADRRVQTLFVLRPQLVAETRTSSSG